MLYCSSECGSISIMQLRIIYCNTHVYTFHVCLCLLALLHARSLKGEDRFPAGPRALLRWFQSGRKGLESCNRFEELNK